MQLFFQSLIWRLCESLTDIIFVFQLSDDQEQFRPLLEEVSSNPVV